MTRHRLNLTARAWSNMRRAWRPRPTAELLWQSILTGPVLSWTAAVQLAATKTIRSRADLRGALVVAGYWRSGTTLLHELLAATGRWSYPTTHACMHPQSFAVDKAPRGAGPRVRRPMDDMVLAANTPQEDEFALLGLGARSPYEAILFPTHLDEALQLSALECLSERERAFWITTFRNFISVVTAAGDNKPLLLKSPPHGERVMALREVLPDCKFAIMVRSPFEVFESAVHMWRTMFEYYALTPPPSDDAIRAAVLANRPVYEERLRAGLRALPPEDFAFVHFEDLIRDPRSTTSSLFSSLRLADAQEAGETAASEMQKRQSYQPRRAMPTQAWQEKIKVEWKDVFLSYGYNESV